MNSNTGITIDLDHDAYVDVSVRRYQSLRNGRDEKGADITFGVIRHVLDEKHVGYLVDELVSAFPDKVEAALIDWGVTAEWLKERVAREVAA